MSLFTIIVMCMLLYTVVSFLGQVSLVRLERMLWNFPIIFYSQLCTRFEKLLTIYNPSWFQVLKFWQERLYHGFSSCKRVFLWIEHFKGQAPKVGYILKCVKEGGRSFFLCDTRVKLGRRRSLFSCITDDRVPSSFHTRLFDTRKT